MKKKKPCKKCLASLVFIIVVIVAIVIIVREARAEQPSVVINEIAWMGTEVSTADEWIELKNTQTGTMDLTGWTLRSSDGTPKIFLEGKIEQGGFFLLERTDDATVSHVSADQIYTGALSNSGEILYLEDAEGNTIDMVDASAGWPAGDNETKATMKLSIQGTWQTGPVGGTPNQENSVHVSDSTDIREGSSEEASVEEDNAPSTTNEKQNPSNENTDSEAPNDAKKGAEDNVVVENSQEEGPEDSDEFKKTKDILISEFLPNPEGSDSKFEWIEISNNGTEAHDLSDWMLDDEDGGSRPYVFPSGTQIAKNAYLVLSIETTGIQLNNGGDIVRLIYPDGSIANEIFYSEKSKEGYSYAYNNGEWRWTETLTPGSKNIHSINAEEKETPTSPSRVKDEKDESTESGNAAKDTKPQDNILTAEDLSAQINYTAQDDIAVWPLVLGSGISALGGAVFVFIRKRRSTNI